jgi:hypothetical protein
MKSLFELIANRPWILIIAGFVLLITVWVVFLNLALRNQPEHLPLSGAGAGEASLLAAQADHRHTCKTG